MVGSKSLSRSAFLEASQERIPGGIPGTRSWGVFRKREYLVNILIMHEQHFHFYSLVVGRRLAAGGRTILQPVCNYGKKVKVLLAH